VQRLSISATNATFAVPVSGGAGFKASDGTIGATANVEVARTGGGIRTLQFKNGLYVGYVDS